MIIPVLAIAILAFYLHYAYKDDPKAELKTADSKQKVLSCCNEDEAQSEVIEIDDLLELLEEVNTPETEKERKAKFVQQQAALDVDYFIKEIDSLYDDYHSLEEDLEIINAKIDISKDLNEVDKLKRYYKSRDKLNKDMRSASKKIHEAEKKLRSAQFKAGMEVNC